MLYRSSSSCYVCICALEGEVFVSLGRGMFKSNEGVKSFKNILSFDDTIIAKIL